MVDKKTPKYCTHCRLGAAHVAHFLIPHVPVIMHGATTVDEKASCSPDAAGDFDGSDIFESALDDPQGAYRSALAVGGRDQGEACSSLRHLPHQVLRAVAVRSRGETATRSVEV